MEKFNAKNLKSILWETLNKLKANEIEVDVAAAIASQSREITRVVNTQKEILRLNNDKMGKDLTEYAK